MMFTHALTRLPGPDFAQGLTTTNLAQEPPDFARMREQHAAYIQALRDLGLQVTVLEPLTGFPDAYFVEDGAVITPEVAVITRPGAPSRRGEVDSLAAALTLFRSLERLQRPATLEGGDVLQMGRHFFIGNSARTNRQGAEQLGAILKRFGYTWTDVEVKDGLHLKSSVNGLGEDTLILTQDFAKKTEFKDFGHVVVNKAEEYACNTLWINGTLLTPAGYPHTLRQLERLGLAVQTLDVSEACKMDGGLTCMSLRF